MKTLTEFINDTLCESVYTMVRFTLYDTSAAKEAKKKIAALAQSAGMYYEPTKAGFKLKVKPGNDVSEIENVLYSLVDGVPEGNREGLAATTEKIKSAIDTMKTAAAPDSGE